jgi:hypothetical protein
VSERPVHIVAEFADSNYAVRKLRRQLRANAQLYSIISNFLFIETAESDETYFLVESISNDEEKIFIDGYTHTTVPQTWMAKPLAMMGAKTLVIHDIFDDGEKTHFYIGTKRYTRKRFLENRSAPGESKEKPTSQKDKRKKYIATYQSHDTYYSNWGTGYIVEMLSQTGEKLIYRGTSKKLLELANIENSKEVEFHAEYEQYSYKKKKCTRVSYLTQIKIEKLPSPETPSLEKLKGRWEMLTSDGERERSPTLWEFTENGASEWIIGDERKWPDFELKENTIYFRSNKYFTITYFANQHMIATHFKGGRLELIKTK